MPRDDIRDLVKGSKKSVEQDRKKFADSVRKDLESFKKKALEDIGS